MSEPELVLRARSGDEVAFAKLIEIHGAKIHWLMGRYYQKGGSHDDLRQAILIGLHKAVRDYQPKRRVPFAGFALLCMQRQAITSVKEGTRGKNLVLSDSLRFEYPTGPDGVGLAESLACPLEHVDPYLRLREKEELAELVTAVGGLTHIERSVVLGLAEGHSYLGLAEILGVSKKAVDNAAQRGWAKLSAHMQAAA